MGQEPAPLIWTFLHSISVQPVTLTKAQLENSLNVGKRFKLCAELHLSVPNSPNKHWAQHSASDSREQSPNFVEDDCVLLAWLDFHANEKLFQRWPRPRRINEGLKDYSYQVEDLRNCQVENFHASRLKPFRDRKKDKEAINVSRSTIRDWNGSIAPP